MLTPQESSIVERLVAALSSIEAVKAIILYGSRARGASHPESDLDIAVVLRELSPAVMEKVDRAKWTALDQEEFLYVNLTPILEKRLESEERFLHELRRDGIYLWKNSD